MCSWWEQIHRKLCFTQCKPITQHQDPEVCQMENFSFLSTLSLVLHQIKLPAHTSVLLTKTHQKLLNTNIQPIASHDLVRLTIVHHQRMLSWVVSNLPQQHIASLQATDIFTGALPDDMRLLVLPV